MGLPRGLADLRRARFHQKNPDHTIRRPGAGCDAISAVNLSERLTADIDAWAEAHDTVRSDAIRQLIEFGLSAAPSAASLAPPSAIWLKLKIW